MSLFVKYMRNGIYPKYLKCLPSFNSTLRKCNRNIHCTSNMGAKMVMEYENKYAYSILENKGYTISLNTSIEPQNVSEEYFQELLKTNWAQTSYTKLFEIFPKLGLYCSEHKLCISNNIFDSYIDCFTDSFKLATDDELKAIFYDLNKWPETPSIRTRNFIEVWVALEDECLNRMSTWSHNELLSFVSLFYMINVSRHSDFCKKCLQKLSSKAKQLTPSQLVQTLFHIGIWRKSPFDVHNLEIELKNNFSYFTIDDLAIMSMGFFKSKTPLRDQELILNIINTVIENAASVHEVSLAALLKIIRYSTKLTFDDRIYRLLDTLQHEVPRLSVMCNVHIALAGTSTLTLHESCLTNIAETVIKKMSQARMKDLERLVLTYGTFNIIPQSKECFFNNVIEELRMPQREEEIKKHSSSFACCIAFLGLSGIYPVDLMNKVLSQEFIHEGYGKNSFFYGKELLIVHNIAQIFRSDTIVNKLSEKNIKVIAKKYTDYVPNENYFKQYNNTEKMFMDVKIVLKEILGGDDYVIGDHILSHHQRGDLIICYDHNGAPVTVADKFPSKDFGFLIRPPDKNIWIALVIAGRNAIIYNTDQATGFFTSKIRELETLGYHAVLVPWSQYVKLETSKEKTVYLNGLIEKSLRIAKINH